MFEVVVHDVGRVLGERDRAEVAREAEPSDGAVRQRREERERLRAGGGEFLEVALEAALAVIARARPDVGVERLEPWPLLLEDAAETGEEDVALQVPQEIGRASCRERV